MIEKLDWLNDDYRDYLACTRYILFKCCKKVDLYRLGEDIPEWEESIETQYIPLNYIDFKWIVDRCNFILSKQFQLTLLPNSFISWHIDSHFVPEYFDTDFTCEYKKNKNNKLVKQKSDLQEIDFISGAEYYVMKKVCKQWKIYGKYSVRLQELVWKIKNKFSALHLKNSKL